MQNLIIPQLGTLFYLFVPPVHIFVPLPIFLYLTHSSQITTLWWYKRYKKSTQLLWYSKNLNSLKLGKNKWTSLFSCFSLLVPLLAACVQQNLKEIPSSPNVYRQVSLRSFSNGFPTAQFPGVYENPVRNVILSNLNNRSTLTAHNC